MSAGRESRALRALQLCPNDHPPFVDVCAGHAAALGLLGYRVRTVFFARRGAAPAADACYAAPEHLARLLGEAPPALLVSHRYRGYRAGLALARRRAIPTHIALAHEFGMFDRLARRLRRNLADRSTRFAGVSEPVVEELRARGARAPLLLPNPLDAAALRAGLHSRRAARAALGVPDHALAIGVIGRLHPKKAPLLAVRAFAAVFGGSGAARLVFVGDGPLRAELQAAAGAGVVFAGFRADARRLLRAFDAVLCCSTRREAFGLAPLEALAAGVPVICADQPGPRFALGGCGVYFRTPGELRAALSALSAPPAHPTRCDGRDAAADAALAERTLAGFSAAALAERYRAALGA